MKMVFRCFSCDLGGQEGEAVNKKLFEDHKPTTTESEAPIAIAPVENEKEIKPLLPYKPMPYAECKAEMKEMKDIMKANKNAKKIVLNNKSGKGKKGGKGKGKGKGVKKGDEDEKPMKKKGKDSKRGGDRKEDKELKKEEKPSRNKKEKRAEKDNDKSGKVSASKR